MLCFQPSSSEGMSGNARERDGKSFSGSRVSRSATEGIQRGVVVVVDCFVDCLY